MQSNVDFFGQFEPLINGFFFNIIDRNWGHTLAKSSDRPIYETSPGSDIRSGLYFGRIGSIFGRSLD
jgi:hypothetical protein